MSQPYPVYGSTLFLKDETTALTSADLELLGNAMNMALNTFCNDWKSQPVKVFPVEKNQPVPTPTPGSTTVLGTVFLQNYTDVSGVFGYHTNVNGVKEGKVFVQSILDIGGGLFYSTMNAPNQQLPCVSEILSHEIFELVTSVLTNTWWLTNSDGTFYAAEVCDPVQGNTFPIVNKYITNNQVVTICDYILPAWCKQGMPAPYNKTKTLQQPLTVDSYGYAITVNSGSVWYTYGSSMPESQKVQLNASLHADPRFSSMTILDKNDD
uniref:Uncharacterized protein n=1 Tax=viral metagenome TaxID=1070528 RepID=A0A6C0DPI5_9ZZZZ